MRPAIDRRLRVPMGCHRCSLIAMLILSLCLTFPVAISSEFTRDTLSASSSSSQQKEPNIPANHQPSSEDQIHNDNGHNHRHHHHHKSMALIQGPNRISNNNINDKTHSKFQANDMAPMNLIPVDRPLISASSNQQSSQSIIFEDDPTFSSASSMNEPDSNFEPMSLKETHQTDNQLGEQSLDFSADSYNQAAAQDDGKNVIFENSPKNIQHEIESSKLDKSLIKERQSQVDISNLKKHLSPVERRFGLFKKHHIHSVPMGMGSGHYGAPQSLLNMVASSGSPYMMSDCERCMIGLNGANQMSGQLQDPSGPIEPPVSPPTTPPIVSIPSTPIPNPPPQAGFGGQPMYPMFGSGQHPFGPLKSKLMMKFPFFMKTNPFYQEAQQPGPGGFMGQPGNDYAWHYQPGPRPHPQMSGALYLKPALLPQATAAYHCVQAYAPSPFMQQTPSSSPFLGASQQESANIVSLSPGPTKTSSASSSGAIKQYQQQQQQQASYSSSSY